MALVFGPDFFARLAFQEGAACRQKLWENRNSSLADDAETRAWFDATWTQATETFGLEDCDIIAKFFNIAAMEEAWRTNPTWAFYVEQMLNDPYGSIPKADAVLNIHKHIIEDRLLKL